MNAQTDAGRNVALGRENLGDISLLHIALPSGRV